MTLTRTADADDIYKELIKTKAFVVPENNPDRLKYWPALGSKEMEVTGIGDNESVADVVLSSAGRLSQIRTDEKCLYLHSDFSICNPT